MPAPNQRIAASGRVAVSGRAVVSGRVAAVRKMDPLTFTSSVLQNYGRLDTGVTLAAGKVASVADQSGHANNASQGTAAAQPTFLASWTAPFRPAATFAGAQLLQTGAIAHAANQVACVWLVCDVTSTGVRVLYDGLSSPGGNILEQPSAGNFEMFAGIVLSNADTQHASPCVVEAVFVPGTGALAYSRINGTLVNGPANVGSQQLDGITLGARFNSTAFLIGHIGAWATVILPAQTFPPTIPPAPHLYTMAAVRRFLANDWQIAAAMV